jgi:hypothetical protein
MRSLLAALFLLGCTSYDQVSLRILDGTHAPLARAHVTARPMYFFDPTAGKIAWPFRGRMDRGVTDEDGVATIEVVSGNPSSISVQAGDDISWRGLLQWRGGRYVARPVDGWHADLEVEVVEPIAP